MVTHIEVYDKTKKFKVYAHENYLMAYIKESVANRLFNSTNSSMSFVFDKEFKKKLMSAIGLEDDKDNRTLKVSLNVETKILTFGSISKKEDWSIEYDGKLTINTEKNMTFSVKPDFLKRFDFGICDVHLTNMAGQNYSLLFKKDDDSMYMHGVTVS